MQALMQHSWTMPLLGGMILGIAANIFMWFNGRVVGISGILNRLLTWKKGDRSWRFSFLAGLGLIGFLGAQFYPQMLAISTTDTGSTEKFLAAGLLVGIGTSMGNGCTSGHGICGISRFSLRSIGATLIFMAFAILTVLALK